MWEAPDKWPWCRLICRALWLVCGRFDCFNSILVFDWFFALLVGIAVVGWVKSLKKKWLQKGLQSKLNWKARELKQFVVCVVKRMTERPVWKEKLYIEHNWKTHWDRGVRRGQTTDKPIRSHVPQQAKSTRFLQSFSSGGPWGRARLQGFLHSILSHVDTFQIRAAGSTWSKCETGNEWKSLWDNQQCATLW